MVFTTSVFIFGFFPLCFLLYFVLYALERKSQIIRNAKLKYWTLLLFSLIYYSFFKISNIFLILSIIGITYLSGILIVKNNNRKVKKAIVAVDVVLNVGALAFLKYFSPIYDWISPNSSLNIIAPLGISFIVFSSISYVVDVYRDNNCCGNFLESALYIVFFPKVVSGPIVLWKDFQPQLQSITPSVNLTIKGINRLAVGFAKKLIISDTIGLFVSEGIGNISIGIDSYSAWICMFLYFLQIYTDFSSYSDISIGISNIFGFSVKENFDFPYTATSITDFWRRWHISLGTWFKEYIYKPLGGSRQSWIRTIINISIIFIITGVWHGCGVLYILWGVLHGICRIFEFIVGKTKVYLKTPRFIKWLFTTAIVMFGWLAFMLPNFADFKTFIGYMFGTIVVANPVLKFLYFSNIKLITAVVLALLGTYLFRCKPIRSLSNMADNNIILFLLKEIIVLALFVMSIIFMVNSNYSPFIYFQY